ncbi:MAG: hypothetical protein BYD32DRAFT_115620 [Podila humilis]|nr:MAG: hypothetical protein BYD32DRAFT_115620 [Podila humilis]
MSELVLRADVLSRFLFSRVTTVYYYDYAFFLVQRYVVCAQGMEMPFLFFFFCSCFFLYLCFLFFNSVHLIPQSPRISHPSASHPSTKRHSSPFCTTLIQQTQPSLRN